MSYDSAMAAGMWLILFGMGTAPNGNIGAQGRVLGAFALAFGVYLVMSLCPRLEREQARAVKLDPDPVPTTADRRVRGVLWWVGAVLFVGSLWLCGSVVGRVFPAAGQAQPSTIPDCVPAGGLDDPQAPCLILF